MKVNYIQSNQSFGVVNPPSKAVVELLEKRRCKLLLDEIIKTQENQTDFNIFLDVEPSGIFTAQIRDKQNKVIHSIPVYGYKNLIDRTAKALQDISTKCLALAEKKQNL